MIYILLGGTLSPSISLCIRDEMSTSKSATAISPPTVECCMCGDYGLPHELFQCKVCQFRSQHRYCSDLYPKAEPCRVCNWCLNKKGREVEEIQNSSIPSSTYNNKNKDDIKNKKKNDRSDNHDRMKVKKGSLLCQLNNPIKKRRSPEPSSSARKKIVADSCMEETIRRTRAEENSKRGMTIQVLKGKVRRFKLLDEVV